MWRKLLDDADFKILHVWRSPLIMESIIEAEPK